VNEAYLILVRPERLEEAVDAVAWKTEIGINAPLEEALDYKVRGGLGHVSCSFPKAPARAS